MGCLTRFLPPSNKPAQICTRNSLYTIKSSEELDVHSPSLICVAQRAGRSVKEGTAAILVQLWSLSGKWCNEVMLCWWSLRNVLVVDGATAYEKRTLCTVLTVQ